MLKGPYLELLWMLFVAGTWRKNNHIIDKEAFMSPAWHSNILFLLYELRSLSVFHNRILIETQKFRVILRSNFNNGAFYNCGRSKFLFDISTEKQRDQRANGKIINKRKVMCGWGVNHNLKTLTLERTAAFHCLGFPISYLSVCQRRK